MIDSSPPIPKILPFVSRIIRSSPENSSCSSRELPTYLHTLDTFHGKPYEYCYGGDREVNRMRNPHFMREYIFDSYDGHGFYHDMDVGTLPPRLGGPFGTREISHQYIKPPMDDYGVFGHLCERSPFETPHFEFLNRGPSGIGCGTENEGAKDGSSGCTDSKAKKESGEIREVKLEKTLSQVKEVNDENKLINEEEKEECPKSHHQKKK